MSWFQTGIVVAVLVLAALTLHCDATEEMQVVTATVSGRVLSGPASPEANASVSIAGQSTTTGASGEYKIPGVPVGNQRLHVSKGLSSGSVEIEVVPPETTYHLKLEPPDPYMFSRGGVVICASIESCFFPRP